MQYKPENEDLFENPGADEQSMTDIGAVSSIYCFTAMAQSDL